MPSQKVKRKFKAHGAQAAFARFAGVGEAMVSRWLKGEAKSFRLDLRAKEWPGYVRPVNGGPRASMPTA